MKISCVGIVHYSDGVVLVRPTGKSKWQLPERMLSDEEDVLMCIRRCVLMQTGYRAARVRLFRIKTQVKDAKHGAALKFIFRCEVGARPIKTPELESARFTPEAVLRLAEKQEFDDPLLLDIVLRYQHTITAPLTDGDQSPLQADF